MPREALKRLMVTTGLVCLCFPGSSAAWKLTLRQISLELPGAPALVLPADVDQDGRLDLAVVVAYTEWDQIDIQEVSEMQGVEGLVEILTVIPTLTDRRELWVFRSTEAGDYEPFGEVLPLDLSILSLAATSDGSLILALTDRGVSVLRFSEDDARPQLLLEPWFDRRPVMAGSGVFLPNLELLHDLETVNAWHLNIQENQVGGFFFNECQGLAAIIGLTNNFDVRDVLKTMCQATTREGFVIHNQGLKKMLAVCCQGFESFRLNSIQEVQLIIPDGCCNIDVALSVKITAFDDHETNLSLQKIQITRHPSRNSIVCRQWPLRDVLTESRHFD